MAGPPGRGAPAASPLVDAIQVLIVDDVEALRKLYRVVLEDDDRFDVVGEAADGRAAIEAARLHSPDLVLLDISMPGMDGLEALPRILDVSPKSTVVILSGFMEDRLGQEARARGASAYMEKNIVPDDLVAELVDIMRLPSAVGTRSDGSLDQEATGTPSSPGPGRPGLRDDGSTGQAGLHEPESWDEPGSSLGWLVMIIIRGPRAPRLGSGSAIRLLSARAAVGSAKGHAKAQGVPA